MKQPFFFSFVCYVSGCVFTHVCIYCVCRNNYILFYIYKVHTKLFKTIYVSGHFGSDVSSLKDGRRNIRDRLGEGSLMTRRRIVITNIKDV